MKPSPIEPNQFHSPMCGLSHMVYNKLVIGEENSYANHCLYSERRLKKNPTDANCPGKDNP